MNKLKLALVLILVITGCYAQNNQNVLIGKWHLIESGSKINPIDRIEKVKILKENLEILQFKDSDKVYDFMLEEEIEYEFLGNKIKIGQREYFIKHFSNELLLIQSIPKSNEVYFSQYLYQKE